MRVRGKNFLCVQIRSDPGDSTVKVTFPPTAGGPSPAHLVAEPMCPSRCSTREDTAQRSGLRPDGWSPAGRQKDRGPEISAAGTQPSRDHSCSSSVKGAALVAPGSGHTQLETTNFTAQKGVTKGESQGAVRVGQGTGTDMHNSPLGGPAPV